MEKCLTVQNSRQVNLQPIVSDPGFQITPDCNKIAGLSKVSAGKTDHLKLDFKAINVNFISKSYNAVLNMKLKN